MSDTLALLRSLGDPAQVVGQMAGLRVYPRSLIPSGDHVFFYGRGPAGKRWGVLGPVVFGSPYVLLGFLAQMRPITVAGAPCLLGVGEPTHANACALRAALPWTAPVRVGVRKSAGLGDRLGIATPGHVRAMRHVQGIVPVLAQQSIREMERTQRSAMEVMDDATWGVFQEGWQDGFGADADHLKTEADIDLCVSAGFVMYTLDPREHVDNAAETDDLPTLERKFAALPWGALASTPQATRTAYAGRSWTLGAGHTLGLSEEQLLRGAAKYGRAVAHLARLYRYLVQHLAGGPFELEVSVDETDTPTSPGEHLYIASELKRLGVEWVSLAPRYIGRFEKGVDYVGDLAQFESTFAEHVAIARALGPYKLSLHSGSDKFSIYPIAARVAGDLIHLKTAGTSYLEALRAVARVEPKLFRDILRFAIAHYEHDKVSYHVSAEMGKMLVPERLPDAELPAALDQFDTRQALHVTFGTVLTTKDALGRYVFRDRLYRALESDEEVHYAALEAHILKHVQPFNN